ncbi:GntR family transcriptional regulator [Paenibacillus sp. MWE-103]|uniref:GntR family transcriptional regulator n=1 Tax=Paenibacillus artemisiicola TaxID=1172618 RepID=A0ABS3WDB9_9BACL|nr:GntR family transcriptional regulator [Paenibacillus artemisiicola]MBO7746298.1 GntR family transcriptional regulator [Paenibacillus artemisiicola]
MTDLPLVEVAYRSIRKQLLDGELLPGAVFTESDLAARLGMSRTPVRSAVALLEKEGFVQTLYKRGILVKGIDVKDLYDIFDLLFALYSHALDSIDEFGYELDLAKARGHLDELIAASEDKRYRDYYENGFLFMFTLLEAVRNRYMTDIFRLHKDKLLFFVVTYRLMEGGNRPYTGRRLYEAIYEKLREGKYQEAKEAIFKQKRMMREDMLRHGYST